MSKRNRQVDQPRGFRFVVILGSNEIASACAVRLLRAGCHVVLSDDRSAPVLRRRMAFFDALHDDTATVDGVTAVHVASGMGLLTALSQPPRVLITGLGLLDLVVLRQIDVLIDARMQKYQTTPDLRGLGRLTIGVGPGFAAGETCHVAVETLPEREGEVILDGATLPPDGTPRKLGGSGRERFVQAAIPGLWHTALEIGTRIYKDFLIGFVANVAVAAPFDGVVRGLVRDGLDVQAGVKLCELDPRGRQAIFAGTDERARRIASGVLRALTVTSRVNPLQREATGSLH